VAFNDALSLKTVLRDAIVKLKSFRALHLSCREWNAVSFTFAWNVYDGLEM